MGANIENLDILAIILSLFSIMVSFTNHVRSEKNDMMPILIYIQLRGTWYLKNIGRGAAIRVVTGDRDYVWIGDKENNWNLSIFASLSSGESLPIITFHNERGAWYTDAMGKEYFTLCISRENRFFEKTKFNLIWFKVRGFLYKFDKHKGKFGYIKTLPHWWGEESVYMTEWQKNEIRIHI